MDIQTASALPTPGNRCGHDPWEPRFYRPSPRLDGARLPKFIERAIEACKRIYSAPRLIPTLALPHTKRQRRSERREALAALAGALVQYMDIETLVVGRPGEKGVNGLTMEELAQLSGLTLRRAERAMADLVRAGVVKVYPICEKNEAGDYKGRAALRTISKHFFGLLGLGSWLERERKAAYKRKRARTFSSREAAAKAGLCLEAAKQMLQGCRTPQEKAAMVRAALDGALTDPPGAPPGR